MAGKIRTTKFLLLKTPSSHRFFSQSFSKRAINKICPSATEAISSFRSSTTILVGGFGFSGVPNTLINALRDRKDLTDFTVVSNNAGMPGVGLGQLLETKQISKMIASFIGENKVFEKMYITGELELELTPQGTMAEKCAAGAKGIPAFWTPAAYGTIGIYFSFSTFSSRIMKIGVRAEKSKQYRQANSPSASIQMEPYPKCLSPKKPANLPESPT
jgi:3-oxoacid CoA-transferase